MSQAWCDDLYGWTLVVRDHEVGELPGILISFDLDLLLLFVDGQSACRQHCARPLSIWRKDELDCAHTVFAGTCSLMKLCKRKSAIGDETESAHSLLCGQFHYVFDVVTYASTC